jgi:type I restriction enzyme R subunit
VTDPDKVFELFNKLKSNGIFLWSEVEQFATAFFSRNKSNAVLANICKPAIERWQQRYNTAIAAYSKTKDMLERCKQTGDAVLIGNAEKDFAEAKKAKDELEIFKKDLGTLLVL